MLRATYFCLLTQLITMQDHRQLTDQEFSAQFEQTTLDAALFNHEAHLRLAWIHLTISLLADLCQ